MKGVFKMDENLYQYEICFPNEYTNEVVNMIAKIMNIKVDINYLERIKNNKREKGLSSIAIFTNNKIEFILVNCRNIDILYSIIVRCRSNKNIAVRNTLLELDNKYRVEYHQDLSTDLNNNINYKMSLLNSCLEKHEITLEEILNSAKRY
jgi:hypothetical protein